MRRCGRGVDSAIVRVRLCPERGRPESRTSAGVTRTSTLNVMRSVHTDRFETCGDSDPATELGHWHCQNSIPGLLIYIYPGLGTAGTKFNLASCTFKFTAAGGRLLTLASLGLSRDAKIKADRESWLPLGIGVGLGASESL